MLRLISAVLHREQGAAVPEVALDLRPAELGIVVPLVACLLALSAWPAAISDNAIGTTLNAGQSSSARAHDRPPEGRMDFVRLRMNRDSVTIRLAGK
jgi:hypothetical protein